MTEPITPDTARTLRAASWQILEENRPWLHGMLAAHHNLGDLASNEALVAFGIILGMATADGLDVEQVRGAMYQAADEDQAS